MPSASVVITTKNRSTDLDRALKSCTEQDADLEVIVIDDGSTDGTGDLVKSKYPAVQYIRHENSAGLIVRRNEGAQRANSGIIFSIDDDAAFSSPTVVSHTIAEFDDERIGAIAIPYINVLQNDIINQKGEPGKQLITDTYIGTAHALRKSIFLKLNGYRPEYFHQGEERDYCIRQLEEGYYVRLGSADPIHHFESPVRSFERMDYYGRRNDVLFHWNNVPARHIAPALASNLIGGILYGFSIGRPRNMIKGAVAGITECLKGKHSRSPVSPSTFKMFRFLKRSNRVLLSDLDLQTNRGARKQ